MTVRVSSARMGALPSHRAARTHEDRHTPWCGFRSLIQQTVGGSARPLLARGAVSRRRQLSAKPSHLALPVDPQPVQSSGVWNARPAHPISFKT